MSIIRMQEVVKTYKRSFLKKASATKALDGINLDVEAGEMLSIVGVSGSGKSTLLNIMDLLITPDSGYVEIIGQDVSSMSDKMRADYRNKHIGYVLQDFGLVESDTVEDNVAIPMKLAGISKAKRETRIKECIDLVGLNNLGDKYVYQLSGGQKQRVAIARAIVMNPEIILADEPTGALDSKTKIEIAQLFVDLWKSGKTVIIVTHDMEIANYCSREVNIKDGIIIEYEKCE